MSNARTRKRVRCKFGWAKAGTANYGPKSSTIRKPEIAYLRGVGEGRRDRPQKEGAFVRACPNMRKPAAVARGIAASRHFRRIIAISVD